jgi:hypothetical protein
MAVHAAARLFRDVFVGDENGFTAIAGWFRGCPETIGKTYKCGNKAPRSEVSGMATQTMGRAIGGVMGSVSFVSSGSHLTWPQLFSQS